MCQCEVSVILKECIYFPNKLCCIIIFNKLVPNSFNCSTLSQTAWNSGIRDPWRPLFPYTSTYLVITSKTYIQLKLRISQSARKSSDPMGTSRV